MHLEGDTGNEFNLDLEQSVKVNNVELDEDPEAALETGAEDDEELSEESTDNAKDAVEQTGDGNTNEAEQSVDLALHFPNEVKNASDTLKDEDNQCAEKTSKFFNVENTVDSGQDATNGVFSQDHNLSSSFVDGTAQAGDDGLDDLNGAVLLLDVGQLMDEWSHLDLQVNDDSRE